MPQATTAPAARRVAGDEFVGRRDEQMESLRRDPEAWDDYWDEAAPALTAADVDDGGGTTADGWGRPMAEAGGRRRGSCTHPGEAANIALDGSWWCMDCGAKLGR